MMYFDWLFRRKIKYKKIEKRSWSNSYDQWYLSNSPHDSAAATVAVTHEAGEPANPVDVQGGVDNKA